MGYVAIVCLVSLCLVGWLLDDAEQSYATTLGWRGFWPVAVGVAWAS